MLFRSGIPQFKKFCDENSFELFTVFVQAEFEILIQRYLHRLPPHDFESSERIDYHAKRIAAIHDEHTKWKDVTNFDVTFHNSGNDLRYIEEMATMVGNFIQERK